MKIAFFEIEPEEKNYIKNKFKGYKVYFTDKELNEKNARKFSDYDIVSIFIDSEINSKIINKFKKLKAITTRSTGYDHIDLVECKKRKIKVFNVPRYGQNTVAEQTFALILTLSRKIFESINRTKKGNFSIDDLEGFDLKGKTLGIVGMGGIGTYVAQIAKGFEMKIISSTHHPKKEVAKKFGVKFVSFNNLLKNSDIITLHVPLTKKTHHLINKDNIRIIKKGAYLINTSRGDIVDTTALIIGLDKGILSGAGLDVLEEEDKLKEHTASKKYRKGVKKIMHENHALLKRKNVVITPHNAFNTKEALNRILDTTVENINSVIKNKSKNLVK
tara:strand:+ start:3979 stop:4971 length:993 start_codon:yes stop_codon:yes gene_type:complete